MSRWVAAGLACVTLWTTETVLPQGEGRQVEERVVIRACLEGSGERILEVLRTVHFRGFPGEPIQSLVELRLPWGAHDAPPRPSGGAPTVTPP